MVQTPESSILGDLEQALADADRCLELARRERERIGAALQASSDQARDAERLALEHARKGREILEAQEHELESMPAEIEGLAAT